MVKRKLYFLIGLITLFASNAQALFINENLKAYVGANIGYAHLNAQLRNRFTFHELPGGAGLVPMDSSINKTKRKDGFMGELLLGMRYAYNTWVAGFEIAGSLDNHKISQDFFHSNNAGVAVNYTMRIKAERKYAIIPALVFGKQLSQKWLAFVKLGLGYSVYEIDSKNIQLNKSTKFKRNAIGFVPSIGLEYGINEKFSCVGTVTYERYKRFSTSAKVDPEPTFINQNYIKIKPELVAFKIGLLFKI